MKIDIDDPVVEHIYRRLMKKPFNMLTDEEIRFVWGAKVLRSSS